MTHVRGLLGSCCLFLTISPSACSQSVSALGDNVSVCAKGQQCAKPLAVLNKGDAVDLELSIDSGNEEWCLVQTMKEPKVTGYVACVQLDRSKLVAPSPMKRVDPVPEHSPTAVSDRDLENPQCDQLNYHAWIARLEFSDNQRKIAEAIADSVGAKECARKAQSFKQRYLADSSKSNKAWLLRRWTQIDPNDSCVVASRQFWRQTTPHLTESQIARLRSDMAILERTVTRIQMDPAQCVPIFCLY